MSEIKEALELKSHVYSHFHSHLVCQLSALALIKYHINFNDAHKLKIWEY